MNKSTDSPHAQELEAQPYLNREFRLLDRYEIQDELVEVIEKTASFSRLVPKLAACHRSFRHKRCENQQSRGCRDWAKPFNSCSVRVCPHCAHRRSQILATRVQEFVVGKTGLRYAVLAEQNSANLQQGIDSLWKAWTRLRRSVCWKRKVKGSIAVLEVTYNKETRTWHPHLNVLMEGEYFPFFELQQAWAAATDDRGRTSYIRAADEGTAFELLKYTLKVAEKDPSGEQCFVLILDQPEQMEEFLSAVQGRRLVRTYGTFRGIVVGDEESPNEREVCPDCGSNCFLDLGFIPPHQVTFDFDKNCLRVNRSPALSALRMNDVLAFNPNWEESEVSSRKRRIRRMHEGKLQAKLRFELQLPDRSSAAISR